MIQVVEKIHHTAFIVSRNYAEILGYDKPSPDLPPDQWYYFDGGSGSPGNEPPRRTAWFYVPVDINSSNPPYAVFHIKPYQVIREEKEFTLILGSHVSYAEVVTDIACFAHAYPRTHSFAISLTINVYRLGGTMVGGNAEVLMVPPCTGEGAISYRTLIPISPSIEDTIKIRLAYTMLYVAEGVIDEEILVRPSIVMARDMDAYIMHNKYRPVANATIIYKMNGAIIKGLYSVLGADAVSVNIGFPPTGILVADRLPGGSSLQHYVSAELLRQPAFTAHIEWDIWDKDGPSYIDIYLGGTRIKHIKAGWPEGAVDVAIPYDNISSILEKLTRNGVPATITFASPIFTWRNAYIYIGNVTLRYVRLADLPATDIRYTTLATPLVLMGYAETSMYSRGAVAPQLEGYAFIYAAGDHYNWYSLGNNTVISLPWLMSVYVGSGMEKSPSVKSHVAEAVAELRMPVEISDALDKSNYGYSVHIQGQRYIGWDKDMEKVGAGLRVVAALASLCGADTALYIPVVLRHVAELLANTVASVNAFFYISGGHAVYRVSWSSGIQVAEYLRIKIKYMGVPVNNGVPREPAAHRAIAYYRLVMDTSAWGAVEMPIYIITGELRGASWPSQVEGSAPPMYMEGMGGFPLPRAR